MIEPVIYAVLIFAGIIVALATRDDTLVWLAALVGMIVIGFMLSPPVGMFAWAISALGAGVLVSWIARDELSHGRVWFVAIAGVSIVFGIVGMLLRQVEIAYFGGVLVVFSLISFVLSYTKMARTRSSKI
ncbi:MAG TPA: hypothetical protein VJK07_01550 [Candidatus Nanoarchaeia archaeon]|nr:hypothetical protein [Candidatus Nanoarchaeia archaeon]